eukprot:TRINITY_DN84202_c0_g1_i1.p1 TRINITY_DN84202_c0_g1~~TRINITY_DN84202_c0_g1_i1.p1  ORF type:complete len:306 (+),score=52.77 TRINITY_DN84202_c0_g1_i1:67-984(+)
MSYTITDRYGGLRSTYNPPTGTIGLGSKGVWWPDYGPSTRDFSYTYGAHPTESIFNRVVQPYTDSLKKSSANPANLEPGSRDAPAYKQFRQPQPARNAMLLKSEPTAEDKLAAHEIVQRKGALQRISMAQKRIDAWLGDPPIRNGMKQQMLANSKSRSLSSLDTDKAADISRQVYEKHGYLVGRSKPTIADGRHKQKSSSSSSLPLSKSTMLFGKDADFRKRKKLEPDKRWRVVPESQYVFDPRTFLPVPRGGWNAQPPTQWPGIQPSDTRRECARPFESSLLSAAATKSLPALADSAHDVSVDY